MKILDLFCGGGGAAMGYHNAGFEPLGIDNTPQPHYPFQFQRADALEWLAAAIADGSIAQFTLIHASPPCQAYSICAPLTRSERKIDLIDAVRKLLIASNRPYIIENVPNAPLRAPLLLCGTMFGLGVIRHRIFETSWGEWLSPAGCCHNGLATGNHRRRTGHSATPSTAHGYNYVTVAGNNYLAAEGRAAMGIEWLPKSSLSQAIPPAYTEYLAKRFLTRPETAPLRPAGNGQQKAPAV